MSIALSTSWNASRFEEAGPLIREIKECGFREVELSFNLSEAMTRQIASFVKNGDIAVTSVHNFCPIPDGISRFQALPDYYSMSSLSDDERALSVKFTKITIDTASRLNAKAVVLHAGRVEIPERKQELIALYKRNLKGTAEYDGLKEEILLQRHNAAGKFLDKTILSLKELGRYAQERGVFLGIENRFYLREIPAFDEIGIILSELEGCNIFYWHDTGHAQVMENLGLGSHKDYLDLYGSRMIGAHLHDVSGVDDHRPLSKGDIDFSLFKRYFKKDTLKVIEAHQPALQADLIRSRETLEELFDEN